MRLKAKGKVRTLPVVGDLIPYFCAAKSAGGRLIGGHGVGWLVGLIRCLLGLMSFVVCVVVAW